MTKRANIAADDFEGAGGFHPILDVLSLLHDTLDRMRFAFRRVVAGLRPNGNSHLLSDDQMVRFMYRKRKSFESASEQLGSKVTLDDLKKL